MPKTDKNGVIHYNAESRSDYLSFISEFPRVGTPQVGGTYVFTYYFNKNPDFAKIPIKKKFFYSWQPIDLCFYVSQKKKYFMCINLNQLSVTLRRQILKHLRRTQPEAFSEKNKRLKFRQLYSLLRLFQRCKISVRRYAMSRATEMRAVPPDEIDNLIEFTANFYYRGSYQSVIRRRK